MNDHELQQALLDIPEFLIAKNRPARPPRLGAPVDDEARTARICRQAQENAEKRKADRKKKNAQAREAALTSYRKMFGANAPHPESKAASAEQRVVFKELRARERTNRGLG